MSMMRNTLFAMLALLLVSAACESDDPTGTEAPISVTAYFNLNIDGAPLQRNSMIYSNPSGTVYSIKELRFIISDLKLHADDGRTVTLKNVHYYDVNEPSTQAIHVMNLPHANFISLSFTFGLDASKNLRNKYPSIPLVMVWPAALGEDLGYHYMQLEGNYETTPGGATGGYTTHTGPRQLDGTNPSFPGVVDPVAHHFFFSVNAPFTPTHIHDGGHGDLEISFDLNGWYLDHTPADGNDTEYDFTALPNQAIMGHLDEQGKLQTNGPGCFSASLVAIGGHH
jgi:hypothetical protein